MAKKNSVGSPSDSETRPVKRYDTLANVPLAAQEQNTNDTSEPGMTVSEALAVAWTGIEALAGMNKAFLFRSKKSGTVWIELRQTDYDPANGFIALKADEK